MARAPVVIFLACAACSNAGGAARSSGGGDGGAPGGDAAGAFTPAAHPAMPQIVTKGGPVIAAPRFVAITFAGDELAPPLEAFVQALGASVYFAQIGADYGIHAGSALAPVRLAESAPGAVSDVDVRGWMAGKLAAAPAELPAPASDVVYVVFYPAATTITKSGDTSCSGFDGYHDEVPLAGGARASFAVVARCTGLPGVPAALDAATAAASHELVETVTDPLPTSSPAYSDTDDDDPAWPLVFGGGEVADLCEHAAGSYARVDGLAFTVHRSWSNAASKAGHEPCVPAPAGAYFASVPVLTDTVTVTVGTTPYHVRGVSVAPGQTRTVDVALFSDAPSDAWTLRALDASEMRGGAPNLKLALGSASGKNGDVVALAITVLAKGQYGGEPFVITSTLGARTTYAVGLVAE